jgi:hypothetical protein
MALPDNFAAGIHENAVRNATSSEISASLALSIGNMVVLYQGPALFVDACLEGVSPLVSTEADDSDFALPVGFAFLEHILVVPHGSLARRTPGGPEIEQNDLSFLVFDVSRSFTELSVDADLVSVSDDAHLVAKSLLTGDIDFEVITSKSLDLFHKSIFLGRHALSKLSRDGDI